MYDLEDHLEWRHGDCGTLIFNGLLFSDDGFGNYIRADMRICFYFIFNWIQ